MAIIRSKMKKRAACAVLVLNDLTGQILSGPDVQVGVPGQPGRKPVRKSDGYFVFLEEETPIHGLWASAGRFQERTEALDLSVLDPLRPVVRIRLTPGNGYGIPSGTAALVGRAEPGALVTACRAQGGSAWKLLEDYDPSQEKPSIFRLYGAKRPGELEGRFLVIRERGRGEGEILRILENEDTERNEYRLQEPLKKTYSRGGAELAPVFQQKADQDGAFFLLLTGLTPGGSFLVSAQGGDGADQRCELIPEPGKINRVDLLPERRK